MNALQRFAEMTICVNGRTLNKIPSLKRFSKRLFLIRQQKEFEILQKTRQ
jgi:hypothetical protein